MGHEISHLLGSQGSRKHWQSGRSQRASPEVARVSHSFRLHPRVPQSANGKADFLSCLPKPATDHDRTGSSSLIPVNGGIFLIRACDLRTRAFRIPGVGLRGLVPHPESAGLGGLPSTSSKFRDFRAHGPHTRIDDLSPLSGRFVARVTTAVTTDDCRPGRGEFVPAADTDFASVFAVPSWGGTGSAESPATATRSPSVLRSRRASHREPTRQRSLIRSRPPFRHWATRHLRLPCRLRAAFPLGRAEEHPPPMATSHLLLIMASGPAGPLIHPLDV